MISNESNELESMSQKYGFDFVQAVPMQLADAKINWSRHSEPKEKDEAVLLRKAIDNKPKIDISAFLNSVSEFAKLGQKEGRFSEVASSRVSTNYSSSTTDSQSFFRFSSGSKRAGSEIFGMEPGSIVRNTSLVDKHRTVSEV